ncbi:hypothetical protein M8J76_016715 [Diaphorina citri]|nr:hypothetical protein M8J76_016715 [Diaphorina citri]
MHDLIYDERFVPDFKSQTDYDNIRKHAAEYFNNEISVIDYTDIESVHLIIRYFKSIYLDLVLNKEKYLNDEKLEILEKLKNELIDHNILNEEQAIAEARDRIKGKKKRKGGKGLPLTVDNKGKKQKNIPRDEIRSAKEPISIQPTEDTKDIKSQENKVDRYFEDFLKNELFQNKYREIEDLEPTLTDVKMKLYTIVGEYYRSLVHYEPKQLECILYTGGKNMGECVKLGTKLDELILEKNQQKHFLQEIQQLKTDLLLKQTLINRLYSELENEFIKYCSFDGSAGSDLGDLTNEFKENSLYGPQTEI